MLLTLPATSCMIPPMTKPKPPEVPFTKRQAWHHDSHRWEWRGIRRWRSSYYRPKWIELGPEEFWLGKHSALGPRARQCGHKTRRASLRRIPAKARK